MSSREKRAQVIDLLMKNAANHPNNYTMYIYACVVAWHFKDAPYGMATVDQVKVYNFVHLTVDALHREFDTEELYQAHQILHELGDELIEKLKAKGIIVDDDTVVGDDEWLEQHKDDFSEWTKELNLPEEK